MTSSSEHAAADESPWIWRNLQNTHTHGYEYTKLLPPEERSFPDDSPRQERKHNIPNPGIN